MSVFSVALAAWVGFILLRSLAVPQADRRAAASRSRRGIRAAAIASLTGYLSLASLTVAVGTSLSLGVVACVNAAGGATLREARGALERVGEIRGVVSHFSVGVGVAVTVALILGMAYQAYRCGGRRLKDVLRDRISQDLLRLKNGDLEFRAPNEEMRLVAARIADLERSARDLDRSEEDHARLRAKIEELRYRYDIVDVERRIDLSSHVLPELSCRFGRAFLFVSSVGMLRSLKGLGRVSMAVGLLLLLPASMTVGVAQVRDAAEKRLVDLEETIDSLELKLDRERVASAFASLPTAPEQPEPDPEQPEPDPEQPEPDPEQPEPAPGDGELIDEIAAIFESEAIVARYLGGFEPRPVRRDVANAKALTVARNEILSGWASARSSTHSARVSIDRVQQRIVELARATTRPRRPVTTYGQRFSPEVGDTVARLEPERKEGLRRKLSAYWGSFHLTESPGDLRALLVADLLGYLIGGGGSEDWVEVLLRGSSASLATDLVEASLKPESQRLVVALVESPGVGEALRRLSNARTPLVSSATTVVREAVEHSPALESEGIKPGSLRLKSSPGDNSDWTYEAKFSPQDPRSRSYDRLHRSPDVGGVLIGRSPQDGDTLRAERLEWKPVNGKLRLHLLESGGVRRDLGSYDPAIVHSALGYAADGRVATVTIVADPHSGGPRVLVHPALADTRLGCSAIRLDLFVPRATECNAKVRELRRRAVSDVVSQHRAYKRAWAIRFLALSGAYPSGQRYNRPKTGRREALEQRAWQVVRKAHATSRWPEVGNLGFLKSRSDLYDLRLVNDLLACGSVERVDELDRCLLGRATEERYGSDDTESWATPFLEIKEVSGVREHPWTVDDGLTFVASGRPLGPFRFIVQVVFSEWSREDGRATVVVEEPLSHEFRAVEDALTDEIVSWRNGKCDYGQKNQEALTEMAEFTHLQRLFRALLDGRLVLTEMDLADLVELAGETAEAARRAEMSAGCRSLN